MNNKKKLWLSVVVTALIAFPAGWAIGEPSHKKRLLNAFDLLGEHLFGRGNFSATAVRGISAADNRLGVQIDIASGGPPDDNIPVLLNVFGSTPPDDSLDACVATAQIAVTSEGVRVIINPDVMGPTGGAIVAEYGVPLGGPPDPCREVGSTPPDDNIGDNPG